MLVFVSLKLVASTDPVRLGESSCGYRCASSDSNKGMFYALYSYLVFPFSIPPPLFFEQGGDQRKHAYSESAFCDASSGGVMQHMRCHVLIKDALWLLRENNSLILQYLVIK